MRTKAGLLVMLLAIVVPTTVPSAAAEPRPAAAQRLLVTAAPRDTGTAAERRQAAEDALAAAQRLFADDRDRARRTPGGPTPYDSPEAAPEPTATEASEGDATMVLRDLVATLPALDPADRATARSILARPTDGKADEMGNGYTVRAKVTCTEHLCVHWVASTADAPSLEDTNGEADGDGVPDQVETTAAVFEEAWAKIVTGGGYRAPLADGDSSTPGPNGLLDVYLADLGGKERPTYGYCTTDDPERWRRYDVSAYCAVDDDFAAEQYGGAQPGDSLRATAAHEFFHAVQFSYDFLEDLWLMEGTATWVEDEVFDDVDDNLQYLADSPLRYPLAPLDYPGTDSDGFVYGNWIFWRFLSEYLGAGAASDPTVVRQVWRRLDARAGARDEYSLQAVRAVLAARGVGLGRAFAAFGARNQIARRWYDEGARYPVAPVLRTFWPSRDRPTVRARQIDLDHLSNVHVGFRPASSLTGTWRLRLLLDLPTPGRGAKATVAVHRVGGDVRLVPVRLDRRGNGVLTVPFDRRSVARVNLTLSNTSSRMSCGGATIWSCQGVPLDDGTRYVFAAKAVR